MLEKLATGTKTARQLANALDVSQPSISRSISNLGRDVLVLGKGRATQYARPRIVRGTTSTFPVFRIDQAGDAHLIGRLHTLLAGQYWWHSEENTDSSRLYNYLPWFIQDMRPDGFLGRAFANKEGTNLSLPEKLNDWNDDDVLIALSRRGEDHIGNLVIGDESIQRYLKFAQQKSRVIADHDRPHLYPVLAEEALSGDPAGSSAGGEQQKFTAAIQNGDELRHVLVKFSSPLRTQEGRRWADLLMCEHCALDIVNATGIAASQSRTLETGNRLFLEVDRFDRTGSLGRCSTFSLRAIDGEYTGIGDDWAQCAVALQKAGVISKEDAKRMRWLKAFGSLIGNTDMHTGNLSFIRSEPRFYTLAPVYDMLPMLYRPVSGDIPERAFSPTGPTANTADVWESAVTCALNFWDTTAEEQGISGDFRVICKQNLKALHKLKAGPKIIAS
ncbi:MAG: type II toxin-antitoxin system HipA family toxin YjjJ [Desulfuromonadales bacterium]|nr:type II toxin-antitoxin system HipA family toxin YjjJ [Desulfuromonadales bacterium]